jgi:chorismate mutase
MNNLDNWRSEIDDIDREIMALLNRRASVARDVGRVKARAGLPVVDIEREDEILRRVVARNEGLLENETVLGIYRRILETSREIQIRTMAEAGRGRE